MEKNGRNNGAKKWREEKGCGSQGVGWQCLAMFGKGCREKKKKWKRKMVAGDPKKWKEKNFKKNEKSEKKEERREEGGGGCGGVWPRDVGVWVRERERENEIEW